MEAPIVALCVRSLAAAQRLINVARSAGIKRASLVGVSSRIMAVVCVTFLSFVCAFSLCDENTFVFLSVHSALPFPLIVFRLAHSHTHAATTHAASKHRLLETASCLSSVHTSQSSCVTALPSLWLHARASKCCELRSCARLVRHRLIPRHLRSPTMTLTNVASLHPPNRRWSAPRRSDKQTKKT